MGKFTYDQYLTRDAATYLYSLFLQYGLHVTLSEMCASKIISEEKKYEILLTPDEVKNADIILFENLQQKGIQNNHDLNNYTDKDLSAMIDDPEKWGKLELMTAMVLLNERNSSLHTSTKHSFMERLFSTVKNSSFRKIPKFG